MCLFLCRRSSIYSILCFQLFKFYMNLNKVMLIGRVTRDPEMRTTQGGQSVTTLSIATNRVYTDKNGQKQEQAEFHNIVFWGKLAEIVSQYVQKGQVIYVDGRLQTRVYTAQDGTERRITEVVAENMQLGPRSGGIGGGASYSSSSARSTGADVVNGTSVGSVTSSKNDSEIPVINLEDDKDIKLEEVPF